MASPESHRPANDDSTQWESFSFDLQPSDINNFAEKKESNQLSCSPTQSAMINMSLDMSQQYTQYNKQEIGKSCEKSSHPHSQSSDTACCNYQSTIAIESVTTPSGNNSIQRKFLDNYNEDQPSTSSNTATAHTSSNLFNRIILSTPDGNNLCCPLCDSLYPTMEYLKSHQFFCVSCPKAFSTKSQLKLHKCASFCEICKTTWKNARACAAHKRFHTSNFPSGLSKTL